MTSADDMADDVTRANISKREQARDGAWRVLAARGVRDQPYRNFERRVEARAVSDDIESFTVL